MVEAFFGQTLPWGQMSYWSAQVMTSLAGVMPGVGDSMVEWLRGDVAVGDATLHRFFALHVIALPLVMIVLVVLHIIAVHQVGSNNPDGIDNQRLKASDTIPFYPKQARKDGLAILVFLLIFFSLVFFFPDWLGGLGERTNLIP